MYDFIASKGSVVTWGDLMIISFAWCRFNDQRGYWKHHATANLDSKSTENLLDIMENLNHKENITFIFSTHDQRVVNKAHRVITIEDGRVISDIQKK